MEQRKRIVTRLPLDELWCCHVTTKQFERIGFVDRSDNTLMLREGPITFVIADVGCALDWISLNECFSRWKSEIKFNIVDIDGRMDLSKFPNEYVFVASLWIDGEYKHIVVLEKHH